LQIGSVQTRKPNSVACLKICGPKKTAVSSDQRKQWFLVINVVY